MSEENLEVVRLLYEAYRRGEVDAAIDVYLHPEIEWETRWPGLPPWFHGRDGVREWLARVMEPMEVRQELLDVRPIGDQVLATFRLSGVGRSSGIPTAMSVFDLLTFRDGMISRRQVFYSEGEALEAAEVAER